MNRMIAICFLSMSLMGCHQHAAKKQKIKTIVAKLQSNERHYYFSGYISPISTTPVLSPVEGSIEKLNFTYGQPVSKGQVLMTIDSPKLRGALRDAIASYLSKKSSFLSEKETFNGTTALHKAGVIDQQDYQTAYNQYQNSVLSFYQEQYHLKKTLQVANIPESAIQSLTIADIDKLKQLLDQHYSHVTITAPTAGVALFPLSSANDHTESRSSDRTQVTAGSIVHVGQLLVSVGDLSGLSVQVLVGESSVNALHVGMPVTVTGDAFQGIQLKGEVAYVASQAQPGAASSNGQSRFAVRVMLANVPVHILRSVHVGMTAKVDIHAKSSPQIMVPIQAVDQHNGQAYLTVLKDGKAKTISVSTGETTLDSVAITKGLAPGDQVVVRD